MFLNTLHELNALVTDGLRKSGLNIIGLQVGESTLTSMDFIKPDHTTISVAVPVYKISGHQTPWIRTIKDWADVVVSFVLDTANEFTRPRVHLSNVYLNYDPRSSVSGPECIHFDIAIWDYVDSEVQWLEVNSGSGSLVDSFELGRFQLKIRKQPHVLLKQNPFEVNVWTQNILRDIGYITAAGNEASAFAYLNKLKQELLADAGAAAETLSKMERGAQIHDAVNAMWQDGRYQEAAEALTKASGQEIGLYGIGDRTFLTLGDSVFGPDQAFALIAGQDIEEQDPNIHHVGYEAVMDPEPDNVRGPYSVAMPSAVDFFKANDPAAQLTGLLDDRHRAVAEIRVARSDVLPDDEIARDVGDSSV